MAGFYKQILIVDLSKQTSEIEKIDEKIYLKYLGAKGLCSKLLFDLNSPGVDPMSPDNHLIFSTGPVTGTLTWGSSRYGVFTKSPLTGFYLESYSGGKAPEAISATGFDAIVLRGKAKKLSVLEIFENRATFHDAQFVKGKNTFQTEQLIKERLIQGITKQQKAGVVVIGPAGEAGVSFANIKNDGWRFAGRGGAGAVLGSKNIKAIIFKGEKKRTIHDLNALKQMAKDLALESKENMIVRSYKSRGTSQMVRVMNSVKGFPTKYWENGSCDHFESISSEALHDQCDVTPHACAKCFLACGRMTKVLKGEHKGLLHEGPEYETIYAFGGLCMIQSIEEIIYLNHLCDAYGMDTITAGNLCAFTMKASASGKTDFKIDFGDTKKTIELINLIKNREGIGKILSKGIVPAAKKFEMEDQAVHVKGMEPAGYDPRILKGMSLAYATSERGACHLRATIFKPELAGIVDPMNIKELVKTFIDFEDRHTLFDCMILCRFYRDLYPWEMLGELLTASTGIDGSQKNLEVISSNISLKVRQFNLREGMTKKDELLPKALYHPLKDSNTKISDHEFSGLLKEYYKLRRF
ncbi:MAG: aldehyde ferredoxin oxidoreductase family protein [Desulfobacteraceae bacterium]|nr:aldehyde ferredoxin oxidoreductase family protein [Desulfobacteraceae bacterium]